MRVCEVHSRLTLPNLFPNSWKRVIRFRPILSEYGKFSSFFDKSHLAQAQHATRPQRCLPPLPLEHGPIPLLAPSAKAPFTAASSSSFSVPSQLLN